MIANEQYIAKTPQQYQVTVVNNNQYTARAIPHDLALFYQDDFAINRKFTFSYGLRWETQNEVHQKSDFALDSTSPTHSATARENQRPSCAPAMDGSISVSPCPTDPTVHPIS